jgi:methionyl-tRNA formyltransferase
VERAILAGDERTGVCVMDVAEGLDTGAVYRCVEVPIGIDTTADELRATLVSCGTELLLDALRDGLGVPTAQVGESTYAAKIEPSELEIGAWTSHNGKRLKVWRSHLSENGSLDLLEVQPEGKARMPFAHWANGARWKLSDPLGT